MAKAINWPAGLTEHILAEDTHTPRFAFRLGTRYFAPPYWMPDEVVDIRVDQQWVRVGQVVGPLQLCPLGELPPDVFENQKPGFTHLGELIDTLTRHYQQAVTADTLVTVVTYHNLPPEASAS
jgi:hypothetical protein